MTPTEIPKPHECPKRFCFHWVAAGDSVDVSRGIYSSLDHALQGGQFVVVLTGRCSFYADTCRRSGSHGATSDHYEPSEPELRKAGLPETYYDASGIATSS